MICRRIAQAVLLLFALSSTLLGGIVVRAQQGADYIARTPMTVYESDEMSPQTIDYDKELQRFPAHAGWYNDRLVHYYKFRIFAPPTYPDVITESSTSLDVPLQKLYVPTYDGTLKGAVGSPILQYHHVDGVLYSDFSEIVLVPVPSDYEADTYKSEGDVLAAIVDGTNSSSSAAPLATGIILNFPVVPTNSTLQDPETLEGRGTAPAPIDPVVAWYKGVQVWTYVFEVTDSAAAEYFAATRPDDPTDPRYAVTVVSGFATSNSVQSIPLFFLNPYTVGVDSTNFGGPDPTGMRNILNLDRTDDGYSPLWQLLWLTQLPINYMADQASNVADLTPANGFEITPTPIFVNCPTVGSVGTTDNPFKLKSFQTSIVVDGEGMGSGNGTSSMSSFWLMGTAGSLILVPDVEVELKAVVASSSGADMEIAATKTIPSGSYQYLLEASDLPEGATSVVVVWNGTVLRTVAVMEASADGDADATEGERASSGAGTIWNRSGSKTAAAILAAATVSMAMSAWN